jgi:hypothetical protein
MVSTTRSKSWRSLTASNSEEHKKDAARKADGLLRRLILLCAWCLTRNRTDHRSCSEIQIREVVNFNSVSELLKIQGYGRKERQVLRRAAARNH